MSAAPKFTPGPWLFYKDGRAIEVQFGPDRVGRGHAPVVHWAGFDSTDMPLHRQAANARLMAAAPDLYAIAREARCPICGRLHELEHLRLVNCGWCDRRAAALAKVQS